MVMNPLDLQGVMPHSLYCCLLVFSSICSCTDTAQIPLLSLGFQCFLKIFSMKPSIFLFQIFLIFKCMYLNYVFFQICFYICYGAFQLCDKKKIVFSHLRRLEAQGQCAGALIPSFLSPWLRNVHIPIGFSHDLSLVVIE